MKDTEIDDGEGRDSTPSPSPIVKPTMKKGAGKEA
jgi:hypothetical protein